MNGNGPIRLNVPLMLAAPLIGPERERIAALVDVIVAGELMPLQGCPLSPVLQAMIEGFKACGSADIDVKVHGAIDAVASVEPDARPDGRDAEPPIGDFSHMLGVVAEGGAGEMAPGTSAGGACSPSLGVLEGITEIERLGGASGAVARRNGLATLSAGQNGSPGKRYEPPLMAPEALCQEIEILIDRIAS